MSKKIIFKPAIAKEFLVDDRPVPAVSRMPEWFKKFSRYTGDAKSFIPDGKGNANITIKACPPFMDVFSSGYLIELRNDIFVDEDMLGNKTVAWGQGGDDFVSTHLMEQIPSEMIPDDCDPQPFKFLNIWSMILPKGYSALITHPLNRYDLPFITLSGIVDLDTYHNPVNFPFVFKKSAKGIIPAGTPIAQVFPFKRESWTNEIEEYNKEFTQTQISKLKRKFEKSYKSINWVRKSFK